MNKYFAGVILAFLFLSSCGLFRHTKLNDNYTRYAGNDSISNIVAKNYFKYEWFSAKAKFAVINDKGETDFTATIRARRDSVIWVSISPGLGIEVARVLLTKDSVKILDRFNKKYYARDYSVFKDYTSIPVTLEALENIIAGIPIYFDGKKVKQMKKDTMMLLTSTQKKIKNTLYLNPDYTILRMDVIDSVMGKGLNLKYKSYNRDNAKPFASEREIDLNDAQKTNVFITFSKVKINEPLKFPFVVKYE